MDTDDNSRKTETEQRDGMEDADKTTDKGLVDEIRSEINKLTSQERWLCKAMFGFSDTRPTLLANEKDQLKSPESACLYVFESLWPSKLTDSLREKEQQPFPLQNLVPTDVPALFHHTPDTVRDMFREGRRMNDLSQTSFVRGIQKFQKVFAQDLSVKSFGHTRIWISGSVSLMADGRRR